MTDGIKCAVCGEILVAQEVIPATGHTVVTVPGKEPTCTTMGWTESSYCSVCGEVFVEKQDLPMVPHTYDGGKVIQEATYTQGGIIRYTCEVCGTYYEIETAPLAHEHTGGEATCCQLAVCELCGQSYGEYDPNNHVHTVAIPEKKPTCTEDGHTGGLQCADCGAILEEPTVLPATGHEDLDGDGKCDHDGVSVVPDGGYTFETFRCKMCAKYEANKDIPFVGFIYTIVHFFVHLAHYIGYLT